MHVTKLNKSSILFVMPLALTGILSACGGDGKSSNSASTFPIADYIGHEPSEMLGGSTFWQNKEVSSLLKIAIRDDKIRSYILSGANGEAKESKISDIAGDGLYAFACDPNNCSGHNWAVAINFVDRKASNVCYYDESDASGLSGTFGVDGKRESGPESCEPNENDVNQNQDPDGPNLGINPPDIVAQKYYKMNAYGALTSEFDHIVITSHENSLVINKITANKGNCYIMSPNVPMNAKYGDRINLYLDCDPIEIEIDTDKGPDTINFQN